MRQIDLERALTRRVDRRRLVGGAGLGFGVAISAAGFPTRTVGARQATPLATPSLGGSPFGLGIASGDPLPDSVILWTRLALDPLAEDGLGGMDRAPVEVRWELASDDSFGTVVQSGSAVASPDLAHSVHVDVTGLEPGREYVYRFMVGSEVSPVGRTKTAPATGAPLDRVRFALATCQNWEAGYFGAYRHMLQDDLDLVLFLGDYIYEGADAGEEGIADGSAIRRHTGGETQSLVDYRLRHALYKTDADLQAAHAAFPFVATWDDHEVVNDYAALHDEAGSPEELFAERRAAAYQAYYEHMPLRAASMPEGPSMPIYRRLTFGDLAEFSVLDTRQYRSDHPCGAGEQAPCDAALDPNYTMLGPQQEQWLLAGLGRSTAQWNVIAQQVLMAELNHREAPNQYFWTDAWDGYVGARNRLLTHLESRQIANPVVVTGDWHCAFVNDLRLDFGDDDSPTVASEFVVTSISSQGDSTGYGDYYGPMIPYNPHIHYFEDRRGYQRVEITRELWRTDLQMMDTVLTEDAGISTAASYVVESGQPGPKPA